MFHQLYKLSTLALLFLLCGLLFFPFIGEIHLFDWDETLVASISKEMYQSHQYITPTLFHKYYLEKPPFFNWLQEVSYMYFGAKEFSSRLPNAICGLLVILTLYKIGRRIFSKKFGVTWCIVYLSLFLPQLYHKTGLLEPWFNFFVFLSLYNLSRIIEMRQERAENFYRNSDISIKLFWSALACTGAIMTKGIEGYFIVLMCYWGVFIVSSAKYGIGYTNIVKWTLWVAFFLSIWIGVVFYFHGGAYIKEFLQYQLHDIDIQSVTKAKQFSFHFFMLLIGCFPASIIAFNTLQPKTYESNIQKIVRLMMVICLLITFIIATFLKRNNVLYSSLAYLPISFLAAYNIQYIFEYSKKIKPLIIALLVLVFCIWGFLLIIVPMSGAHIDFLQQNINSPLLIFALSTIFSWNQVELLIGICYVILFSIGFIFICFNKYKNSIIWMFLITMVFSQILLVYYFPKIENYTQGAMINFLLNKSNEKAYIYDADAKNYAISFYSDSLSSIQENLFDPNNLTIYQRSNYPVYIIKSIQDTQASFYLSKYAKLLYKDGLYKFFKLKKP